MKLASRQTARFLLLSVPILTTSLSALEVPTFFGDPGELQAQYRDVVMEPDPTARVFALAIRFPAGTAEDPPGAEGTAFLLGRVLEEQGAQPLAEHGSTLRIEVTGEEFLVTLVSTPERWREAWIELEFLLYRANLSTAVLETTQRELLEILAFEAGAPVRTFELERAVFLLGPTDPAARPVQGTATSIAARTILDLQALRSLVLQPNEAVLAASGPVQVTEFESLLSQPVQDLGRRESAAVIGDPGPPSGDSIPPAPALRLYRTSAAPPGVPTLPPGPTAWTTTDRILIDEQLTSTWISVAFAFPRGTPQLMLDFLGHLVLEGLTPSPPDPGLFEAQVSRVRIRGAPVLVVTASVDPQVTSRWEERLLSSVPDLAVAPPQGAFFELARRRFRAAVLLELAVPENRVRWLARQVALESDPSIQLDTAIWSLRRAEIASVAEAAGPSRTILFGPQDMMDR